MKAHFKPYTLHFKRASGTSRGVLHTKETYFIVIQDNHKQGVGECNMFKGLSIDDRPDFLEKLQWACSNISLGLDVLMLDLIEFPSIQFGLEQAFLSFNSQHPYKLFQNDFTASKASIPINGLIWMGTKEFMYQQIKEKLKTGFTTIKLKIGAIDFEAELELLTFIRSEFNAEQIELRVDANGAFLPATALEKLKRLSEFELHSIEQPIRQGQWQEMADLCSRTPLPIALDEELIGVFSEVKKQLLLQTICPQFIILKPALVGGFKGSEGWISMAKQQGIDWWITSALESNIGLNAIAQWTFGLGNTMPQGLGTGALYTNNIECPLEVNNGALSYSNNDNWNFKI
ncbi:MAG: o-succinylbenzoate synthase [Flavobacteriaceae bacterium]|nr:MAG: o-succinylbenzoate synthase [Flavobacteriaceae bacterium]